MTTIPWPGIWAFPSRWARRFTFHLLSYDSITDHDLEPRQDNGLARLGGKTFDIFAA
jgi:hypothetical protein